MAELIGLMLFILIIDLEPRFKMPKEKLRQKKVTLGSWITLAHPSSLQGFLASQNFPLKDRESQSNTKNLSKVS